MTADIASLQIRIDSIEARNAADDLRRLAQSGGHAETATTSLANAFVRFAGPAALAAAAAAGLKKALDVQREFDGLNSGLITATGSAAKAAQAFKALQGFAATTPYSLAETTKAFIQMRNLGLDPSERALKSYGNTASAMGKSLNQLVEAVADAATGEFERLKEFGIKAKQSGDQVALTFQGSTKVIKNNAAEIEKYLQALGETKFAGGMDLQAATLSGAISNLGDTWDATFLKISQSGIGDGARRNILGLSGALTDLGAILDAVSGSAGKEGKAISEASLLHTALTTAFETVAVLGINVAYVFKQVGNELGGLAAQASLLAQGEFAQIKIVNDQMKADGEAARKDVDARSAAILGASAKAAKAAADEAEAKKASGRDDLAQYKTTLSAAEKVAQAEQKRAAFLVKYASNQEQLTAELKKQREEMGASFTPADEARIRKHYAEKDSGAKKELSGYQSLITSIKEKTAANRIELASGQGATDSQKATVKLDQELAAGKITLSAARLASVRAALSEQAASEALIKTQQQEREVAGHILQSTAARKAMVAQLDVEYASYGKINDVRDIAMVAVRAEAELEKTLSDARRSGMALSDEMIGQLTAEKDKRVEVEQATMAQSKALSYAAQLAAENDKFAAGAISDPKARAQALLDIDANIWQQRIKLTAEGTEARRALESAYATWYENQSKKSFLGADATKANELLVVMTSLDDIARSAAASMATSFGKVGKAIGGMTTALSGFGKTQAAIAAEKANAIERANGDPEKIRAAEVKAAQASGAAQIRQYSDMTSAAAGFFGEQSKGYQALQAASKVFHAAELAMTLAELVPKGISAVLGQGSGDPYTAFARMAAMAAIVTGLGVAISGGSSSAGGAKAADVQKKQGTGTVFSDSSAKTDSIAKSLDRIENSSYQGLDYSAGMLEALRSIEASMSGLGNLIVRTTGLADGKAFGVKEGQISKVGASSDLLSRGATDITKGLFGPGLGDKIASFVNNLYGKTTQKIVDSGIQFGGSVNALQAGQGYSQYASVDQTKSTLFGLAKKTTNSFESAGLSDELASQFGMIFTALEETLKGAAVGLGLGADSVTKALDGLILEATTLSLKDLKGDDLTAALNAVISKAMDQISEAAFPSFDAFRKVGEGYAETVIRVAQDFKAIDVVFDSFGKTFGKVGLESIAARERLIEMSGGLEKFTSQGQYFLSNFFSEAEQTASLKKRIQPVLTQYGLSTEGEGARKAFRDLVLSLDTAGEAGARAYATLQTIAPAFIEVTKAVEQAGDILELQAQMYEANGDKIGAATVLQKQHTLALADLTPALAAATQATWDAQAAQKVREESLERANAALDLQAQIFVLLGDKAGAAAVLQQQHAAALLALDPALRGATARFYALQDAASAFESMKAEGAVLTTRVESTFNVIKTLVDKEKAIKEAAHKSSIKSVEERITAETKAVAKQKSLAEALRSTLDSMRIVDPEVERAAAKAKIRAALVSVRAGGALPDADSLKDALSVVSKGSSDQFSSLQDFQRDFYSAQNDVAELSTIADKSLSMEEKLLASLEGQKTLAQAAHEVEVQRLDDIVSAAREQVDILMGKDVGMLTLAQAMEQLTGAMLEARKNPIVAATETVSKAYQTALGRTPEAAGLEFWQGRAAAGDSIESISDAIRNSPEAKAQMLYQSVLGRAGDSAGVSYWTKALSGGMSVEDAREIFMQSEEYKKRNSIPAFEAGGNHYGGARLVGEDGPEIEVTGPSRIISNRNLLNSFRSPDAANAVLAAEVSRLTAAVDRLQAASDKTATATTKTADLIDSISAGGGPLLMEIAQ